MVCPLCEMRKITEWKLVVCRCSAHPDKWMCVYGKHEANPPEEEKDKMRRVMGILFPGIRLREPVSIKDHYHLHEV